MNGRATAGQLDRDFVTIYFLQGQQKKQRFTIRRVWLVLGIIALVFAGISVRVWQQMQVMKLAYQTDNYRREYQALLDEHRILLSQRDALASLGRIESIARDELGLETPRSEQLVFLVDPVLKKETPGRLLNWFRGVWGK